MALNALTLSSTSGIQGRPFTAEVDGLTTGHVDVLDDGTPGFSTTNGRVSHAGLPYLVNTVVLREWEPGVGAGYRDTRIDVTGYSVDNPAPQQPADGTAVVSDAETLAITNSAGADAHNATVSITGNSIDSISLAATVAMVDNGDAVPLESFNGNPKGNGTVGIAAGGLNVVRPGATSAIIADGDAYETVDGGTISVAIAAGVPTFTYTPA